MAATQTGHNHNSARRPEHLDFLFPFESEIVWNITIVMLDPENIPFELQISLLSGLQAEL